MKNKTKVLITSGLVDLDKLADLNIIVNPFR